MSDALLHEVAAQVAGLAAEYREGKSSAKQVARMMSGRIGGIEQKVDAIDQRTLGDSRTIGEVLHQTKTTNGRVGTVEQKVDALDERVDELERQKAAEDAVREKHRWRFAALIAVVTSVTSTLLGTTLVTLLLR